MGSKFLMNYLRQKWWYLRFLFATAAVSCDVYSGVKLHTQLSCGLVVAVMVLVTFSYSGKSIVSEQR